MSNCQCNGMEFICNRWVFTGQCTHDKRPLFRPLFLEPEEEESDKEE